jgi:hypothetical protein
LSGSTIKPDTRIALAKIATFLIVRFRKKSGAAH